jgi:hypothetical protein
MAFLNPCNKVNHCEYMEKKLSLYEKAKKENLHGPQKKKGGCLAMDSELFCGFMKGIVEVFERDENFRKIYLPSSKS